MCYAMIMNILIIFSLTDKECDIMSKKAKDNSGFTLVELIVVIVILAILIGVTVVGVMKYINDARRNIDIHNVSTINTALQEFRCNEELYNTIGTKHGMTFVYYEWIESCDTVYPLIFATTGGYDTTARSKLSALVNDKMKRTFPDGYPKLNTPNCVYRIGFIFDLDGNLLDVYCGVYSASFLSIFRDYGVPVISMTEANNNNHKTYKRVY